MTKKADSVSIQTFYSSLGDDEFSVKEAKETLGWTELDEKSTKHQFTYSSGGKKVRVHLANNSSNRPFRMGLSVKYRDELLRHKWQENGETIIVDDVGGIISGAHRLVALVLAEEMRKDNDPYYKSTYGWKGPITMPILLVTGISKKTADTVDLGQKRSGGDVLFRNQNFGKKRSEADQRKLANDLSFAARLVWLRIGGKKVSDAPSFPHSEMLDFIKVHPRLIEAVEFVFDEDGGSSNVESTIRQYVSRGYMAGLMFLFAHAKCTKKRNGTFEPLLWEKAQNFVVEFASGAKLQPLKDKLVKAMQGGFRMNRDTLVGTFIKAWNMIEAGKAKDLSQRSLKLKKDEFPRVGGLDIEIEATEEGYIGPKSVKGFKLEQTVSVEQDEVEPWTGKIIGFSDDKENALVENGEDVYEVPVVSMKKVA